MKLWYTNNSPFTSYTTVTPHSDSRSDFFPYVMSYIQYTAYKIIACIKCATVLQANIMRVTQLQALAHNKCLHYSHSYSETVTVSLLLPCGYGIPSHYTSALFTPTHFMVHEKLPQDVVRVRCLPQVDHVYLTIHLVVLWIRPVACTHVLYTSRDTTH